MTVWEDALEKPSRSPDEMERAESALTSAIIALIEVEGLKEFLQHFSRKGLGETAESWIGMGEKESATPQDVQLALGVSRIEELARLSGLTPGETSVSLATIVPEVVHRLTPGGVVPEGEMLTESIKVLKTEL